MTVCSGRGELPVPLGLVRSNDRVLVDGTRTLASCGEGEAELWIVAGADRSTTVVMDPKDY